MPEYKPLIDEYAQRLQAQIDAGKIKESTMKTYLRDASRLFEALIWAFSEKALVKIANIRGFGGDSARWPGTLP